MKGTAGLDMTGGFGRVQQVLEIPQLGLALIQSCGVWHSREELNRQDVNTVSA